MKPKNFPERKNQRRLRALERLDPKTEVYKNTKAKLVIDARDIRTKKRRG